MRFSIPALSRTIGQQLHSNRQLVGYGAVGAAALCISYQFWNGLGGQSASSSSTDHSQIHQIKQLLWIFPNKNDLPKLTISHDAALCQLALNGLGIGDQIKPEFTLRRKNLDTLELKTALWMLMSLYKIRQNGKQEKDDHLLIIKAETAAADEQKEEPPLSDEELKTLLEEKAPQMGEAPPREGGRMYNYMRDRMLAELIKRLKLQTEFDPNSLATIQATLPMKLPRLLINALDLFRGKNKELTLATLKTLANTMSSRESAEIVTKSEWLSLLASMITDPVYDEERVLAHKILVNTLNALGAESTFLPPHLYELHRPTAGRQPKIDIIFVHGLRGSAFHTWRQRDEALPIDGKKTRLWPKDWLAKDMKEPVRMIALDYSTDISKKFQLAKSLDTLEARAARFQTEFARAGIGQRPVVFICHSMGGLLVKQMLMDNPELLQKTVGILFIATPHRGTPIASQYGRPFLRPTEDVLFLKTGNQLNRQLEAQFAASSKRIPLIWTILECKETPFSVKFRQREMVKIPMMMVPIESGAFGRGPVYHLDEHHYHLCKPVDKQSPIYGIVCNFVNDSIAHLKSKRAQSTTKMAQRKEEKNIRVEKRIDK